MTDDLDRRLQHLDDIEAPDLSARIGTEPERPLPPLPSPRRRVMVGVLAFVVAAAGFAFLVTGRSGGSPQNLGTPSTPVSPSSGQTPPPPPANTVSVSGMLRGRLAQVRCTATVPKELMPGRMTGLTLTYRNLGDRPVSINLGVEGSFSVSTTGGRVYDTGRADLLEGSLGGGISLPIKLQPGASRRRRALDVPIMWAGPLTLSADCAGVRLPPLGVKVSVPGRTPSVEEALSVASHALGGLFSQCRPKPDGTPTIGTIHTPDGKDSAPPMQALCSATVRQEVGFAIVRLVFVTPPSVGPVSVSTPYNVITAPARARPMEVSVWELEVDASGAHLIGGDEEDSSWPSGGQIQSWGWTGSSWEGPSGGECGGEGVVGGPYLVFISACPTTSP
jgi:hypothetical protein